MAKSRGSKVDAHSKAFATVVREAIRVGDLDPRGKTDEEFAKTILEWVTGWPDDVQFSFATDHRPVLLRYGRQFVKSGEHYLAALLFATWTEHWVNGIIDSRCYALGLTFKDVIAIIRSVPLAGKVTWLFQLLGGKRIHQRHVSAILKLADLRNSFVHYKWKSFDSEEEEATGDAQIREAVEQYGKTLQYLRAYENRHILHSARQRVGNVVANSLTPASTGRPAAPSAR